MGLFFVALVLFLLSLFLINERWKLPLVPFLSEKGGQDIRGYKVWAMSYDAVRLGYMNHSTRLLVMASVLGALMIIAAPFLVGVLSRSRLLWWLAVACSSVSLAAFFAGEVWSRMHATSGLIDHEYGIGYYCDSLSIVLNFIGFLWVRKDPGVVGVN